MFKDCLNRNLVLYLPNSSFNDSKAYYHYCQITNCQLTKCYDEIFTTCIGCWISFLSLHIYLLFSVSSQIKFSCDITKVLPKPICLLIIFISYYFFNTQNLYYINECNRPKIWVFILVFDCFKWTPLHSNDERWEQPYIDKIIEKF